MYKRRNSNFEKNIEVKILKLFGLFKSCTCVFFNPKDKISGGLDRSEVSHFILNAECYH